MSYYFDYHGHVSSSTNHMGNLQGNMSNQTLHELSMQHGTYLVDGPSCYDPYSLGYPFVGPTCHVCGFQGHTPADCRCGKPYTPDCYGMSFAPWHDPYHNNYSPRWPGNPNMTYRNDSPEVSSFSSSYPMQGFRNEEAKSQAQLNFEAEQQAWFEDFMKMQQEKMFHQQSAIPSDADQEHVIPENEEKVAQIREEEKSEIKEDDVLEENIRNEQEVGCASSKNTVVVNPEDKEEANEAENGDKEEIQVDMPILMQECVVKGLSNILCDILPYEISATTLHCMIPSLKVELKCYFLKLDDAYSISATSEIDDDDSCYPNARMLPKDACSNITLISHANTYHHHHVLYCYAYIIGFSIDDLEGIGPVISPRFYSYDIIELNVIYHPRHVWYRYAYAIGYSIDNLEGVNSVIFSSCCERISGISRVLCQQGKNKVRVDIPWDPGGSMTL